MESILISGATGFIGSNIASTLVEQGFEVHALHRTSSSFDKCEQFKDKVNWINTDLRGWKNKIIEIKPTQVIHTAWGGIDAANRNSWDQQIKNFWFSKELFDLAKNFEIKKVIALGSQAEYGIQKTAASEETLLMPNDAYGSVKALTANYLRNLFDNTNTSWYWIRVFSLFGENENDTWLIPTVLTNLLKNRPTQLTPCEQLYNYLYIKDFVYQLLSVVKSKKDYSGIYNICDSQSISIKDLLLKLSTLANASEKLLQFGKIPYRNGQNMMIAGNNSKFISTFSPNEEIIGLNQGLKNTIQYHKSRQK